MAMSQSILDAAASPFSSPLNARGECPHGLRPGTTVCLYCLRDERAAARQRRYRVAARFGLIAIGGGLVLTLIVGGIVALAPGGSRAADESIAAVVSAVRTTSSKTESATRILPAIAVGRTDLGEGMYAERAGDSVIVHFDTPDLRTRFDWKFEGVVRATLPTVFPQATDALTAIPQATFVHGGSLLEQLPQRGIRLPLGSDGALTVWPITRPGEDGPLVVAYGVKATP
jgi:hypothetical protein